MSTKSFVCAILLVGFILSFSGLASAQDAPMRTEQVKPGDLKGFLKDSKGKPFSKVELSVVNEKGEVVQKAVTNQNGEYLFKDLPEGNYTLNVSGKPAFALQVTPAAGMNTIQARLPSAARDPATGALMPEALTALEWTLIVVGGVAVAVAVPTIIHHNDDDDDDKKVSP